MAIGGFLRTFLPSGWISGEFKDLKNQNLILYGMLKGLFTKSSPERQETFKEAMARLGLTEEDVKRTQSTYRLYAIFFLIVGIAIFVYGFYLLFDYSSISGWLLAMASTGLSLAWAFRFDFWAYQMRVRRLGVTLGEWKKSILGDKGTSS